MYKVVGVEIKSGSFNKDGKNIPYNNLYLYCIGDSIPSIYNDSDCIRFSSGNRIESIKIKNDIDVLKSVFNNDEVSNDFIIDLVGNNIDVIYNKYGSISSIKVF